MRGANAHAERRRPRPEREPVGGPERLAAVRLAEPELTAGAPMRLYAFLDPDDVPVVGALER